MVSFRNIRRQARRDGHKTMLVPALYLRNPAGEPLEVSVRVHTKFFALGRLPGNESVGERVETTPKIIFDTLDFLSTSPPTAFPTRGSIVSVELGEAYKVDHLLPQDGEFLPAVVTQMSEKELLATFPDGQPVRTA